jgi:type 1 glutamine amidotransferase
VRATLLRWIPALALVVGVVAPAAAAAEVPHVFVFTRTDGFRHSSIPHSRDVIADLAASTGAFTVEFSEDTAALTPELLDRTDVVLFANTTGEHPFSDEQKALFEAWLLDGGGFMGIHAAADTNYTWPAYQELVGAAFESHPHNGNQMGGFLLDQATVQVEDPDHPILEAYGGVESFPLREEYYRWREDPRGTQDVHVLLSLDETSTYTGFGRIGTLFPAYVDDQPLEWTKSFRGANRVWYTNLGHYDATYDDPRWQAHLVAAVGWVAAGG